MANGIRKEERRTEKPKSRRISLVQAQMEFHLDAYATHTQRGNACRMEGLPVSAAAHHSMADCHKRLYREYHELLERSM